MKSTYWGLLVSFACGVLLLIAYIERGSARTVVSVIKRSEVVTATEKRTVTEHQAVTATEKRTVTEYQAVTAIEKRSVARVVDVPVPFYSDGAFRFHTFGIQTAVVIDVQVSKMVPVTKEIEYATTKTIPVTKEVGVTIAKVIPKTDVAIAQREPTTRESLAFVAGLIAISFTAFAALLIFFFCLHFSLVKKQDPPVWMRRSWYALLPAMIGGFTGILANSPDPPAIVETSQPSEMEHEKK
jgi:hypothetical protein